jgi:hypothetical protein
MKRTSIAGLFFAALCLLIVGTAFAKGPTNLTLKTAKGAIATGQEIKAESTNLVFETSAGNLECTKNVISGPAGTNGTKKDAGKIEHEESTGSEAEGTCKTTTPLGRTSIAVEHLPWEDIFTSKGVNEAKGKKITFVSTFPDSGGLKCTFETAKVKSSFTIGGPVVIHTVKQKFKANKKTSGAGCPKEGTLTGDWTVTSGGETVESELT